MRDGCRPRPLQRAPHLPGEAGVIPILAPLVCIPVMHGLDPIRANLSCLASSSCAGLTRASIFFARKFLRRSMDCRVKPGNDDLKLAPMGLGPRIHVFLMAAKSWMAGSNPRIKSGDGHDEF